MKPLFMKICVAVAAVLVVVLFINVFRNPYRERRTELHQELASLKPEDIEFLGGGSRLDEIHATITGAKTLWQELIPPPPPPPAPPPPPPAAPDLKKMLSGVTIMPGQTGSGDAIKVRISTPANKRGEFMGVGTNVNGLTIKTITRESVEFTLTKDGKEYTTTLPRK